MYRNKREQTEKKNRKMGATMKQTRSCTISESIIQSCKEVKNIRTGKKPKRSLSELFADIEKWSKKKE